MSHLVNFFLLFQKLILKSGECFIEFDIFGWILAENIFTQYSKINSIAFVKQLVVFFNLF